MLLSAGYYALPEPGNGRDFPRRHSRHALRLTQCTPLLKPGFNHQFIHRADLRIQRGARDKQLHQLGLRYQAQAQGKRVVCDLAGRSAETHGHVGRCMPGVNMREVIKRALTRRNVQPFVPAAAKSSQQVRFRGLRVAI